MLEQMGIQPESSHHEEGHGQNEIDFRYSDPVTAADNAVTFCAVVRTVADRNGLCADFSPKPLPDQPGSGMHINFSVKSKDGRDVIPYVIAGIMQKIPDITLFLNPCHNSYDRLGGNKAPGYISWSSENRSQLIRIPAARGGISPGGAALAGLHRQPLPGLRRPHLRWAPRHRMGTAPAGTGGREPAHRAAGGAGAVSEAAHHPGLRPVHDGVQRICAGAFPQGAHLRLLQSSVKPMDNIL